MKKLFGIGIGPGDRELITLKAYNLIRSCNYVFLPESKGESLAGKITSEFIKGKQVIELSFPMGADNQERYLQAAILINETLKDDETGVFLTLGDPMTYSTYAYLMKELIHLKVETETIPGITSYNAAAALLGLPITLKDESLYLADGNIDEEILKRIDSVCILKVSKNKQEIIDKLERNDFDYTYVKRCTQANQAVLYNKEEMLADTDYMSLIFARRN
ncbi:MAG: precorrin-2 C(20)-methyltransferase [Clostridiales bacterium GWB2_37_7]|nr:MAG: precorrin-2 C(20)-methyltransferase [Clostridiales bacterium GWB2_37_7]